MFINTYLGFFPPPEIIIQFVAFMLIYQKQCEREEGELDLFPVFKMSEMQVRFNLDLSIT